MKLRTLTTWATLAMVASLTQACAVEAGNEGTTPEEDLGTSEAALVPFDHGCPTCGFTLGGDLLAAINPTYLDPAGYFAFDNLAVTVAYSDGSDKTVDITGLASVRPFLVPAATFAKKGCTITRAFMTFSGLKDTKTALVEPLSVP